MWTEMTIETETGTMTTRSRGPQGYSSGNFTRRHRMASTPSSHDRTPAASTATAKIERQPAHRS